MKCAVTTTTNPEALEAIDGLCDEVARELGEAPTFVTLFFSPHHAEHADALRERVVERLGPQTMVGCTGAGIIGGDAEIEGSAGLALWAAVWPQTETRSFSLKVEQVDGAAALTGWPDEDLSDATGVVVLADPYSVPPDLLLDALDERFGPTPIVGGMASGGRGPMEARMVTEAQLVKHGAVVVVLRGRVRLDPVVSQGCRPIGSHFVITKGRRNVIEGLGGKPAFAQLMSTVADADPSDRELVQQGFVHVGRVVDERKSTFEQGDYLVRHVMGVDRGTKAIAISDRIRPGQTIQFMVRDADTATDELVSLLAVESVRGPSLGALMFSCAGRGQQFFGRPNHDVGALHDALGDVPAAGFFCAGEIGPVGGHPFLHGFTASIAVFRDGDLKPDADASPD